AEEVSKTEKTSVTQTDSIKRKTSTTQSKQQSFRPVQLDNIHYQALEDTLQTMFSWINIPKVPEATWSEVSTPYVELFKTVTYSEIDHKENPVVYRNVPSIPIGGKGFGVDFSPLTFLSCYFVQSHKAEIKMPSGNIDKPVIEDNHDGTVTIKYDPAKKAFMN
ncbi:hypothetical protein NQ318_002514, partial [Aromia moschata]